MLVFNSNLKLICLVTSLSAIRHCVVFLSKGAEGDKRRKDYL